MEQKGAGHLLGTRSYIQGGRLNEAVGLMGRATALEMGSPVGGKDKGRE